METAATKKDIIAQLKQDILRLEGFKPQTVGKETSFGLGALEKAFPYGKFPVAAVHEFLCDGEEDSAATNGFLAALLSALMQNEKSCIWISPFPHVFPPSLTNFGISPDRIIFVQLRRDRDILWAMEEALKCNGLTAVIAELEELTFTQSRRLQLAVENSQITGFVLRKDNKKISTTACVSRWRINPLPSFSEQGLPGIGFPQWQVELLKVKNGQPGVWQATVAPKGLTVKSLENSNEAMQNPLTILKTGT